MSKRMKKNNPPITSFSELITLVLKQMIIPIQKVAREFQLKLTYTIEPMVDVMKKGEIRCSGCSTAIKEKKAIACPDCEAALCSFCHESPESHECEDFLD